MIYRRNVTSSADSRTTNSGVDPRRREREHWTLNSARLLLVAVLGITAALFGYLSFRFLNQAEQDIAKQQFASIADRALSEARQIALGKRWAIATAAAMISENYAAAPWPFVTITGFERIVSHLLRTSRNYNMGFAPMLRPDQAPLWEEFMFDYYYTERGFPNSTALNSFGAGIWGLSGSLNTTASNRYHDDGRSTLYGSPNQVLFPVAHANEGLSNVLMFNLHSEPNRGRAIDKMIECIESKEGVETSETSCGVITNMLEFFKYTVEGPSSLMFQPITVQNRLLGLVPTPILWVSIFENVFSASVSGVDCVLETTDQQQFSYTVQNGVAVPRCVQ